MHISSRENLSVKEIVRLRESAKARREAGLFVCEGEILLSEALKSGLRPRAVFAHESTAQQMPRLDCPVHTVTQSVLEKMCDTVTPRGPVFTLELFERSIPETGAIIALDGVSDPGNVGTIIRCADAFGASVALLGAGADIFAPKIVRAAMGSLFRVNINRMNYSALSALCAERGSKVYCAALSGESMSITDAALKNACVIIGNEAHGVSADALEIADGSVMIPMHGAESLNAAVAAAICMWEAVR